jgi:hypothetical protein
MKRRRTEPFNRGRWEVERERFQISERRPQPPERQKDISDVIPNVMKSLHLEDHMWTQRMNNDWEQIVGEQLAKNTRPGRMRKNTLVVFVSNSAWLAELNRFGKTEMLDKLQERYGKNRIARLQLQLDPDGTL